MVPELDTRTPVVVLRGSFAEYQHAVLAVARSMGRLGIPVFATSMRPSEPATRSRYINARLDAYDGEAEQQWLDTLLSLNTGHPAPVLVPIDDVSAVFVHDHEPELGERFVIAKSADGLHRQLSSKHRLWELCQRHGVPTPTSRLPQSEDELSEIAEAFGFPIVLKRSDAWLPTRDPSAPSVLIAHTRAELVDGYRRMESPIRPQVIAQEYIPGDSDTIWMFNGYFDGKSECLSAFTGQKLRQRGAGTGPTTLGICRWNADVAETATAFLRAVGYHGIVDMGFRFDARDGRYLLLDVNPRLGSTFRLFVGEDDMDTLRAAYLDLTGQTVPRTHASDGRRWLVEPYDLAASVHLVRSGQLRLTGWLRSLRDVEELAWWARDDPVPFLAMCASLPRQSVRYLARRRRTRRHVAPAASARSSSARAAA